MQTGSLGDAVRWWSDGRSCGSFGRFPEHGDSTANDKNDTCGALKGLEPFSLTSDVGGAPAKAEYGGDKRTEEYAQFRRPQ